MIDAEASRIPENARDFKVASQQKPAGQTIEAGKQETGFNTSKTVLFTEAEKFEHGKEVKKTDVLVYKEE